jgi:hypothetical protein
VSLYKIDPSLFPQSDLVDEKNCRKNHCGRFRKNGKEKNEEDQTKENNLFSAFFFLPFQIEIESKEEEKPMEDLLSSRKPGHCLHVHRMSSK